MKSELRNAVRFVTRGKQEVCSLQVSITDALCQIITCLHQNY